MIRLDGLNPNTGKFETLLFNEKYLVCCKAWWSEFIEDDLFDSHNCYLIVVESRTPNHKKPVFEKLLIDRQQFVTKFNSL